VGSCAAAISLEGIAPIFKTNFLQGDSQNVFVALLVNFLALQFVYTLGIQSVCPASAMLTWEMGLI
jgi:hypothetical protein